MAEAASAATAASGTPDGASAPAPAADASPAAEAIAIPSEWVGDNSLFKPYVKDVDGKRSFDFESLQRDVTNYHQMSTAVPKTADEYQTQYPQDWVMGADDVKAVREAAKRVGMTQAQIEAWVSHDLARVQRASDEAAAELQKAKQSLGGEWKHDFDKNLGMAKKVADQFFGPEFTTRADIGNDPQLIRGLYQIAKMMGEGSLVQGGAPAGDRPTGDDGRPRLKFPSMGD